MIRWYDYVAAVVMADFIFAAFSFAMTAEIWYMSLVGSFVIFALWDIWKFYCEMRKSYESKR